VASLVHQASVLRNVGLRFLRASARKTGAAVSTAGFPEVTALSVEFVAKPQETHRVQSAIPAALAGALKDVSGFAGCLVMISDQEARLVTVITLWVGEDRLKQCRENTRWVHKLLAPYLDRCLRVQTLVAHLPALPMIQAETNAAGKCFITRSYCTTLRKTIMKQAI
jgi:hypothetical protein